MEQSSIQQPKACQVGMCFFPADEHSQYCTHHRSLMEAYDAKLAATELVERCIQCQAKIGSRHTDQCPQPGYVDETQVAVEPIPRPATFSAGNPNYCLKHGDSCLNPVICNAAYSPVARCLCNDKWNEACPVHAKATIASVNAALSKKFQHDIDCAAGNGDVNGICTCGYEEDHPEDQYQFASPVARPQRDTRIDMDRETAPVVAQRETTAETIVDIFGTFARPARDCKNLSLFDKLLLAVDAWAASQRTEGEGQL